MPLFLITGMPGVGKSTVRAALKAKGYEAYDGDEDHLAKWYSIETGVAIKEEDYERTPEFVQAHSRDISRETIKSLASKAQDRPVFLCADPENEDGLWDLFSKIFVLVVDEDTRKHRLATRTNNNWGKLPHEVEYSLAFQKKWNANSKRFPYIRLNSSQPPETLVDQIVEKAAV